MSERDDSDLYQYAQSIFSRVAAVANPVIERRLAEGGVPLASLSQAGQADVLISSFAELTAGPNLDPGLVQLKRVFDAISEARFMDAVRRLRATPYGTPFDPAQGQDAAIVLAGAGLAIAPVDRQTGQAMAPRVSGIKAADKAFAGGKTALVGYAPAEAPFYTLVTDDLRTLFAALEHDKKFADLKRTIRDAGGFPYRPETPPFRHAMVLVARQPQDRVGSLTIETQDPKIGSIVMAAGWMDGATAKGGPGDGVVAAPVQLARTIAQQPTVLEWIAAPSGGLLVTVA